MQDRRAPLDVFVGRTAELVRMAEVIARVEAGQPWLVAVEGDPGVGKTALVRRGLAAAAGLRVMQARASLAEADLDFGIVDQLLRAAGGVSPAITLTDGAGSSASSFAVGARLLEVVGEQQAAGAVAIVIDDLQWAAALAEEAAASLDYGQERVYAAMARAWCARRPATTWAWPTRWAAGRTTRP